MQVYMPCEGDAWDDASDGGERPSGDHRRGPDGQCRVHMLIWSSCSNTLTVKRCPAYPLRVRSANLDQSQARKPASLGLSGTLILGQESIQVRGHLSLF
jgi:hypothetical protein